MRILIADDHDLVRDTLSAFLEQAGGFEVTTVGSFGEVEGRLAEAAPFDLVMLDWQMPGMDGLAGLSRAMEAARGGPVALMSGYARRETAEAALEMGAAGFLPKSMPARRLVNAVKFMCMGERFAPVDFLRGDEGEAHPLAARLTERERQVLEGLCRGLSNKEIARELALQEVTVKLHVKTLCRKLEARNRTHAAMIAKETGLV